MLCQRLTTWIDSHNNDDSIYINIINTHATLLAQVKVLPVNLQTAFCQFRLECQELLVIKSRRGSKLKPSVWRTTDSGQNIPDITSSRLQFHDEVLRLVLKLFTLLLCTGLGRRKALNALVELFGFRMVLQYVPGRCLAIASDLFIKSKK